MRALLRWIIQKIYTAFDALGNPIRFIVTGKEALEYTQALALLDSLKAKVTLADRKYDADYVVAEGVIPSKSNRKKPRDFDKDRYKERTLIEQMFNKIKHFRRVATRYDKAAASLAFVTIAGIYLWLKYYVSTEPKV